jgi:5-methylcytosine-specific restriction endonuclease McrA
MTVNPLYCSLSAWNGLEGYCRWCNLFLGLRQKWCSGNCLQQWRSQHRYYLARQITVKASRKKCLCIRAEGEQRHSSCADCGSCEAVVRLRGDEMTCDHIIPRFGDRSRFSCNHHNDNLQLLCSSCHIRKSKQDQLFYEG